MVAEKGGIVMVNFFPYFLTDDRNRNATVQVDKSQLDYFLGRGGAHQPYQGSSWGGTCGNR